MISFISITAKTLKAPSNNRPHAVWLNHSLRLWLFLS